MNGNTAVAYYVHSDTLQLILRVINDSDVKESLSNLIFTNSAQNEEVASIQLHPPLML